MLENIKLSIQGIWSHKLRSLLTMLGIIIGIAAIIAIVSAIQGTNERLKEKLIGQGNNLVQVQLYEDSWAYSYGDYSSSPTGVNPITDTMLEEIKNLDHVANASTYNSRTESNIYVGSSQKSGYVYGVDNSYFTTTGYIIKKGRLFTDNDSKNFTDVCVIDETMANTLFGTKDPIGQIIEIRNVPITVVGIIEEAEPYEATYDSLDDYQKYAESNSSTSGVIYLPQACWPNIYNFDEVQNIVIKSDETTNMSTAGKAVADYLNQYITTSDSDTTTYKYKAEDKLQELRNEQELSNETNSMLVSVTERTREIGLKIAIGAPKGKIRAQFLTEAVALTSLGGLIGIVAGIVLAKVISNVMQTPFAISIPAMIVAVVFSMVIGVIFGLFPAIKASNLNPIDALRYE